MKSQKYRDFIDDLVSDSLNYKNSKKKILCDSRGEENFVKELDEKGEKYLRSLLYQAYTTGVFNTLRSLSDFEFKPFEEGYEGFPYHDYIGRVDENDPWQWPE